MHTRRSPLLNATSLVLCLGLILIPLMTWAGVFPDYRVALGSHAASTATNHTIEFVTRQGLTVAAHTLEVRYASGFSLTSVAFSDIDLAMDNDSACNGPWTDKALESGASPSADAWGVAVSGQTITFTSSATATADIAANRCVQIQIGTNATSGTNRIVNPGSAGSYEIDVVRGRDTGENGEQGMASIAIASTPTVTISATVSGSGSPASLSTPTPTDTTAPIVSNVVVSNITATSATVTWQTNEAASTVLSYGRTSSYELGNLSDTLFRTSHTRSLSGLASGTEHHFQIQATDSAGNASLSPDTTFTTLDVTPPTISAVQVINITETSAMVTWITNELATSAVVIPSASINVNNATLVTAHETLVTGLSPNTAYVTTVTSADASGNSASASTTFTTLADLSPTNVSNLVAIPGIRQNVLSWRNPSDADLAGVIVRFSLAAPPLTVSDGTPIFNGLAETYTHTGLTPGVRYYYTVFAYDVAGNVASGAVATAIPLFDDDHIEDETDDASDDSDVPSDSDAVDGGPTDATGGPTVVSPTDVVPPDATGVPSDTTIGGPTDATGGPSDGVPSDTTIGAPSDIVLPPTTVGASDLLPTSDVSFFVARETIALTSHRGTLSVLGARPLTVELNIASAPSSTATVELVVGSSRYLMNPESVLAADRDDALATVDDATRYRASVQTPRASTTLAVVVTYMDGRVQTIPFSLNVQGDGNVTSSSSDAPLDLSRITLLSNAATFDTTPHGQSNPIQSDTGLFAWYVPNGTYRVEVTADGFATLTSASLRVDDNIVNPILQTSPVLAPLDEELARALEGTDSALEAVGAISRVLAIRGVQSVRIMRQDADVQQAATVAAPLTTAVAATTAVTLATSFNLFRFVQYLVTAPFLLVNRRRRKKWGVVYDSLRKIPGDCAIARSCYKPHRQKPSDRYARTVSVHCVSRALRAYGEQARIWIPNRSLKGTKA